MKTRLPRLLLGAYFLAWFAYFARFWSQAIHIDEAGNVFAGLVNIWGDWAAHFTMGSALGYRNLFLTDSPFLIGARFSYPYAANFLSGLLIQLGVPFFTAFIIPSFLGSCLLILALFYFFKTMFNRQGLAIMASLLFILNGGLGFVYFAEDIANSTTPLQTFLNPPHEYTRIDSEQIKWISVIDSMLIPQRAFNLGFPLTLLALSLIYTAIFKKDPYQWHKLILASLILGLMPIIHTHSFLAAGFILFFWLLASLGTQTKRTFPFFKQRAIEWGIVGILSLSLAIPLYLYFFAAQVDGFLKWHPGWLARDFQIHWVLFWFKNWGIMPLLALAGWVTIVYQQKRELRWVPVMIWLPFGLLFVLINLILFQPFAWDNTKLLVWAAIGFSGLAAYALHQAFRFSRRLKRPIRGLSTLIVASLFVMTIASGTIDAYWDLRTDLHSFQMYSGEEMELANWVRKETPVEAVWLTGDQHNHWLFNLTGRQTLLTYRGWLWTHGYDYQPVESDLRTIYQNPERQDLLQKYQVKYVVIGDNERHVWGADPVKFSKYWPVEKTTFRYTIYRIDL